MKYYVVAGEASGDLHASNLVHHIMKLDGLAQVRAWGGDRLAGEGATIVKHIGEMSIMGFVEVVCAVPRILSMLKLCKSDLLQFNPDVVILVDYPGFNLRIAKFAKKLGFKVVYYISPQVWAWNKLRVHTIKKYVDVMVPILPFEEDFYKKYDVTVRYFGHPLIDELAKYQRKNIDNQSDYVALLPGSRKSELERIFPVLMQVVRKCKSQHFVVAGMSIHGVGYYNSLIGQENPENLTLMMDCTYDILANAKAAIVTSGTATLETALFKVPQEVCYKTNVITYKLACIIASVKYISLVNLILNCPLVPELIQKSCNAEMIIVELEKILNNEDVRSRQLTGYSQLIDILQGSGASERVARLVVNI